LFALFSSVPAFAEGHEKSCKSHVDSCIKKCQAAVTHLEKTKGDAKLIQTLKDCIATCKKHNQKKATGKECSDVCDACAKACEQAKDDALKGCIEECKSCSSCCASEKS